jgi:hypothetical protein
MAQENLTTYHLILDETRTNIDGLIKELEKFPSVQIWIWDKDTIRVGKLPKIFKEIPIDKFAYQDGWLTIKLNEASSLKHVFVVVETKDKPAISELLNNALGVMQGVRLRIEGGRREA